MRGQLFSDWADSFLVVLEAQVSIASVN